jgi:hypothetical protein
MIAPQKGRGTAARPRRDLDLATEAGRQHVPSGRPPASQFQGRRGDGPARRDDPETVLPMKTVPTSAGRPADGPPPVSSGRKCPLRLFVAPLRPIVHTALAYHRNRVVRPSARSLMRPHSEPLRRRAAPSRSGPARRPSIKVKPQNCPRNSLMRRCEPAAPSRTSECAPTSWRPPHTTGALGGVPARPAKSCRRHAAPDARWRAPPVFSSSAHGFVLTSSTTTQCPPAAATTAAAQCAGETGPSFVVAPRPQPRRRRRRRRRRCSSSTFELQAGASPPPPSPPLVRHIDGRLGH